MERRQAKRSAKQTERALPERKRRRVQGGALAAYENVLKCGAAWQW